MALRGPHIFFAAILACFAVDPALAQAPAETGAPTEAEPDSAAPPVVVLDELQTEIRDRLAEAGKKDSYLTKRDSAALAAFYEARNYAPVWVPDGLMTDRARALIERIAAADTDGLEPAAYELPSVTLGKFGKAAPEYTARADLLLSQAIIAYSREAYAGRVDPADVSSDIGYERHLPDPVEALSKVSGAADAVAALVSYNPPHPEFEALRKKLAELRAADEAEGPIAIPEGQTLKLGVADARIGFLRKRLNVSSDVESPEIFDEAVAEAVKAFQASAQLKPDGIVGPRTVAAMNAGPVDLVPAVLVNMEKWRWMPRDLGRFHVRVSIPDYTVTVRKDGGIIHTTRVVVGKTTNKTPIFSDEIEHIVVNPAWNVPVSIATKEMLPAVRANPGALRGYQVFALIKGRYRAVDPRRINWRKIDMRKIQIRQPPGERNALGKIKFMFPNPYSVYLHDTPSKSLFAHDRRAYSHGCVRVMDPMEFADALLSEEKDLNAAYLKKLFGGKERTVKLTRKVPVHLTYFTAWVDEAGTLQTRDDVYGHDSRIEAGLGAS
jgi:murein L,D-transpeptidase YcbB/YkuD